MRHCFIIAAYKGYEQIQVLVESLSFGDVFIHVDMKSEDLFLSLKEYYQESNSVFVIDERVNVVWSGLSQMKATLNLFKAVKNSNRTYDYIHLLSGQDMILMNEKELEHFIESYPKGSQFVAADDIGIYRWRVKRYSFFRDNLKNRTLIYRIMDNCIRLAQKVLPERRNLKGMNLYVGSQWFSITYECMNYILNLVYEENILDEFKYVACSDEHFMQIVLMNSPFKDKVLKENGRYIRFLPGNASPTFIGMDDLSECLNGKYMFARKFDLQVNQEVFYTLVKKIKS